MGAGKKDRRLALQARSLAAANSFGEQIATYTTFATVWAAKTELSGSEQLLAQQISADRAAKFEIYWRPDVTASGRVIVDGVTYGITYIAEVGRRKGLELTVKTIDP